MTTPSVFGPNSSLRNTAKLSLLAAAIFTGVELAPAAVSVSNLTSPHASPGYEFASDLSNVSGNRVGQDLANSFTTGADPVNLVSISVAFAGGFGSGFTAYLYEDNGGNAPGSPLLTLSGTVDPHSGGLFDFSPTGSFTLAANTDYWAVLVADHTAPDKRFPVYTVADFNQTGDVGWSIGNTFASRVVNNGVPDNWIISKNDTPLQFAVNSSVVPESSTSLAIAFGLVLAASRRRR